MALFHSPSIIMSGLAMYLDTANTRSYPGSGTAWTDLSGNGRTGTLTNSPTFNSTEPKSITLDGVDDYVSVTGSVTTSEATFIAWIKRNGSQGSFDGIFFSRGTNTTGLNFYSSTNNIGYHWNDASSSYDYNSNLLVPNNTWCMVAMSVNSTSARLYVNTSFATNTTAHSSTTLDAIGLGRDSALSRYMAGDIAIAQLYTRALSDDEIRQNYNAVRGRFGL